MASINKLSEITLLSNYCIQINTLIPCCVVIICIDSKAVPRYKLIITFIKSLSSLKHHLLREVADHVYWGPLFTQK